MLKTLRARLAVFDRESAVLPRRAPPEASFIREAVGSSEAELEAMECEQFSLSLPPSPRCHRGNSPVQFSRGCIAPNPEARDTVSFGLKDILYTAASDSEDFVAASLDVLPPSGQEARPSPAYTELVEVLGHACERLSLDWPDEPSESQLSKLDEHFLSGSGSRPTRRKGGRCDPEAVKELRRATDLALRATKHTAWAVGRSMAGLVMAERGSESMAESYGDQGEGFPP